MRVHKHRFSMSYGYLQNWSPAQETEFLRYQSCSEKCNITGECYFEEQFLSIQFKWQHVLIYCMPDLRAIMWATTPIHCKDTLSDCNTALPENKYRHSRNFSFCPSVSCTRYNLEDIVIRWPCNLTYIKWLVVCCLGQRHCDGLVHRSEEFNRTCVHYFLWYRNHKQRRPKLDLSCNATTKEKNCDIL